jgi:hypothetical protein
MKWGHRERRVHAYAMNLHLLLVYRDRSPSKPAPRFGSTTRTRRQANEKHTPDNLIHFTTTISHSAYRRGFGSKSPDDNGKSAPNANQTKLLRTHGSGATVNKRQNQSGVAHRALQPVYGRRKNEERINMSEELHDGPKCAGGKRHARKAVWKCSRKAIRIMLEGAASNKTTRETRSAGPQQRLVPW